MIKRVRHYLAGLASACLFAIACAEAALGAARGLELSRPVRPWEFLCAVGQRAALFGNESGRMEGWVYPLKILRDFHLEFRFEDRTVPAEALARTVVVRPESTTIIYAEDTFRVQETLFVPVKEQGAVILLDIETEHPLEIEASFRRDFQLEWPAGLGGTYSYWNAAQRAFYLGEEQKKFAALVGSPTGVEDRGGYQTNYSDSAIDAMRLGVTPAGKDRKLIVIAGSVNGAAEVEATYHHLSADYERLLEDSAQYYEQYLERTVSPTLPDAQLQKAYDWARVGMVQGVVTNPFLGTGLVAGYRTSGEGQRPGFAWYFGRDSFWSSLALNSAGDFPNSRDALEFISKYQRADGKIPHEISQTATFVPWFQNFPYAYASADATPLYIIAMNDYVLQSGDIAFAREKWDSIWKAYEFLRATYDEHGFAQNAGIGHGWVEGGPLLPVKAELYQTGVGIEATRAMGDLAHFLGKDEMSAEMSRTFQRERELMNNTFWIAGKNRFAFALNGNNQPIDEPSVLATVPMWFGLLDEQKADEMISALADADELTDWGMRIISNRSAKYTGGGYHYGSVWPLFTGWAAVGEYRYHHPAQAYENLRANALLALDGSLGHITEVLSGDYYEPLSTSSPHQIWSAAMIVSPILRGMLGLEGNAIDHRITLAPHLPADWNSLRLQNVRCGNDSVSLAYKRTATDISLEATRSGGNDACTVEFRPALSLRARVFSASLDGKRLPFRLEPTLSDQHITVPINLKDNEEHFLRMQVAGDFLVSLSSPLPPLGSPSEGARILSESWSSGNNQLTLGISGFAEREYELQVSDTGQILSMEGGAAKKIDGNRIRVQMPGSAEDHYSKTEIVFHLSSTNQKR